MKTQMIRLESLSDDDAINVRKSNREQGIDQLATSIEHKGILQSLRVRQGEAKGEFLVTAGHRRLAALRALESAGKIDGSFQVPCIVVKEDDASAREASLTENIDRLAMTPVDEFKAFRQLVDDGKSTVEVAERFAVPVRRVEQRLKLAGLHPDVLSALDAGKIGIEAAQAFTLTNDLERQARYIVDAEKSPWMLQAHSIRQNLTEKDLRADSKLAAEIGEEQYVAAGGNIVEDLFGDQRYWTSAAVIQKLADELYAEKTKGWLADGWAWVAPRGEYGNDLWNLSRRYARQQEPSEEQATRSAEISTRMDELAEILNAENGTEEELAAFEAEYEKLDAEADEIRDSLHRFSEADKAVSGVVYDAASGSITFGVIDPKKAKPEEAGKTSDSKSEEDDGPAISKAMSNTMSIAMNEAIKAKVATDPRMALNIAVASLHASARINKNKPTHIKVDFRAHMTHSGDEAPAQGADFDEALAWCIRQSEADLMAYMAELVAGTIDVTDENIDNYAHSGVQSLVEYVNADPLPQFDADGYFAGIKKPLIAAAYVEMTGKTMSDGKKKDMAEAAAREAKECGWLPAELRTPSYDGPGAAQADKAA